jgi:adenylyl-sulfate kinase
MKNPDQLRHILKTISWRIVGTIDTMMISYIITGSISIGMAIGGFEVFTKMILYYLHERVWFKYVTLGRVSGSRSYGAVGLEGEERLARLEGLESLEKTTNQRSLTSEAQNIIAQNYNIALTNRIQKNNHQPKVFWMTGLSGSGKSTLANAFQNELFKQGYQVYVLDGDNIRGGLNKDLDFTDEGRIENIRRISEVAKLFADAGFIVITAFISPFKADRQQARTIIGTENFCEVFVNAPLEICEQRDVKGLYKKARAGEIPNFTGISSTFEQPDNAEVVLNTAEMDLDGCVRELFQYVH